MSYIDEIAFNLGIRNEEPNKALAKKLANLGDANGIKEISDYLFDKNKSIASDCLAVLYHVGYEKPELILPLLSQFTSLLSSKNNRMVWGSMIALSCLASVEPEKVFKDVDLIVRTIENGSVITEVWGLTTLARIATADENYHVKVFPVLSQYLSDCRPIDFAKRTETILPSVTMEKDVMVIRGIIESKIPELSEAQRKKLKAIVAKFNKSSHHRLEFAGL